MKLQCVPLGDVRLQPNTARVARAISEDAAGRVFYPCRSQRRSRKYRLRWATNNPGISEFPWRKKQDHVVAVSKSAGAA
jgi:hypothetical protein